MWTIRSVQCVFVYEELKATKMLSNRIPNSHNIFKQFANDFQIKQ